jgi:2-dehydro-3-deoxy-D-arabinonate dehydratase
MKLFRTEQGPVVQSGDGNYTIADVAWDDLIARDDLHAHLTGLISSGTLLKAGKLLPLAPVGSQEVWAAGVTYRRSREARMEEAKSAGGGDFYDRVYAAERPELFFKSSGARVIGSGGNVRIRRDSKWNVPEPELTLLISAGKKITGYTIGNDMSSRDIEGENPLYLPQAKVYDGACAIGPCIFVPAEPLPRETKIGIRIERAGKEMFAGETSISQIKRELSSLAEYLCRESTFAKGCFLMTGTGIVPPDSFTLASGDRISITIEPIGMLVNTVA